VSNRTYNTGFAQALIDDPFHYA